MSCSRSPPRHSSMTMYTLWASSYTPFRPTALPCCCSLQMIARQS